MAEESTGYVTASERIGVVELAREIVAAAIGESKERRAWATWALASRLAELWKDVPEERWKVTVDLATSGGEYRQDLANYLLASKLGRLWMDTENAELRLAGGELLRVQLVREHGVSHLRVGPGALSQDGESKEE